MQLRLRLLHPKAKMVPGQRREPWGRYQELTGRQWVGAFDRPFGFLDVGAIASTELPFVPTRFGPWTMSVSLHVLILGSTPAAQNNGNPAQPLASIGFTTQLQPPARSRQRRRES